MTPLSVVIITFNEEKHIGRCIESAKLIADDIIVIDSFSTDRTKEVCESHGVRFIQHPFHGHIEQKNFALTQSKFPHVLSLDADEYLSDKLRDSITGVKKAWKFDGYNMNRLNNYCGKWIRHGGWYPDRKLRLMDSRKGAWTGLNPHDKFELVSDATAGFLEGDLLHFTAESEEQYLKKMARYTDIASLELFKKNKSTNGWMIWLKTMFSFAQQYFLQLGFLDGYYGYRLSVIGAWYTYQKYSRLLALQKNKVKYPEGH